MKRFLAGKSFTYHRNSNLLPIGLVVFLFFHFATISPAASVEEQIATVKAEKDDAVFKVQHIINQPVTRLKRTPDMNVATYSPGWFHEGASTPNFDTVDIRTTQETPYEGHQYVNSDLDPNSVFLGHELEFNSMTKYFYTDRSVPKKRLTEAEMIQINDLYRIIGHCNQKLEELQNPPSTLANAHLWITTHKPIVGGIVAGLAVILFFLRRNRATETED